MLSPLEVNDVLTQAECGALVALAEEHAFEDAALVRGDRHANVRKARLVWFDERNGGDWAFERVVDTVIEQNRRFFQFDLNAFAEKMQIAWYGAAEGGHFDWHADIGDGPLAARRKLTIVLQLSDPAGYEGGELELNESGRVRSATRERGAAILFPSFMPHRVTPVIRGERYSMTLWAHGPAFR